MSKVVAKFRVSSVKQNGGLDENYKPSVQQIEVQLNPVYSPDKTTENYQFWTATPNGQINMTINNSSAFPFFKPGVPYLVTFEETTEEGRK